MDDQPTAEQACAEPGSDTQLVPEEEDHDLLTLTLATDRLSVAIAEERVRLVALESAGDERAAAQSRARVAQLEEAAVRHRRVPITAVNAARFYGWEPDGTDRGATGGA